MQLPWCTISAVLLTMVLAAPSVAAEPAPFMVRVLGPAAPPTVRVPPPAEGIALYRARCLSCHGDSGRGDGPVAVGLTVKPRRFSDAYWQDSVDDDYLSKAILEGGFAVNKSAAMPAHPDLKQQVAALVAVVRSMRCPTGTVAVEAVARDGAVMASFTADADARGAGIVEVTRLPAGTTALVMRAAGRADALCRVEADHPDKLRGAVCGPSRTTAQEPR